MLIYDISNEKSFHNIKRWSDDADRHSSIDLGINLKKILIGNKTDLELQRVRNYFFSLILILEGNL